MYIYIYMVMSVKYKGILKIIFAYYLAFTLVVNRFFKVR